MSPPRPKTDSLCDLEELTPDSRASLLRTLVVSVGQLRCDMNERLESIETRIGHVECRQGCIASEVATIRASTDTMAECIGEARATMLMQGASIKTIAKGSDSTPPKARILKGIAKVGAAIGATLAFIVSIVMGILEARK